MDGDGKMINKCNVCDGFFTAIPVSPENTIPPCKGHASISHKLNRSHGRQVGLNRHRSLIFFYHYQIKGNSTEQKESQRLKKTVQERAGDKLH